MAKLALTDRIVASLPIPEKYPEITRDALLRGFGVRVDPTGNRSFVITYTIAGRRVPAYVIAQFGPRAWTTKAARELASQHLHRIKHEGADPASARANARSAPTIADLAERFEQEHFPTLRPRVRENYKRHLVKDILPELADRKVAHVRHADIDALFQKVSQRAKSSANELHAVISVMFRLAIRWGWAEINPATGLQRNRIEPRQNFLSADELAGLFKALDKYPDQRVANAVRLLAYTGARRNEVLAMEWSHLDLEQGVWSKPSTSVKQKRPHTVPLASQARLLLVSIRRQADTQLKQLDREITEAHPDNRLTLEEQRRRTEKFVFPAKVGNSGHITDIKRAWHAVCVKAGISRRQEVKDKATGKVRGVVEKHGARLHDLRHSFASTLASSGTSLFIVGKMLGHAQSSTTDRYSHALADPMRQAAERAGVLMTGTSATVIPLKGKRKR